MSTNWVQDITDMHTKFGVNEVVRGFDAQKLQQMLKFRRDFLQEELTELFSNSADENFNPDEIVDACIDLIVVSLGTLNAFDVDAQVAWDRVLEKNMEKTVGIKPSRPNPLGLPDLIKPEGWQSPTHHDNLGLLEKIKNAQI